MEILRNDLQHKYMDAAQEYEPFFNLEAFKLCSDSIIPSLIFWGPDQKCFFNGSFANLLHINGPAFFGKEARAIFNNEAWRFLSPQIETVLSTLSPLGAEGQLLYLDRKGFLEECYFDYSLIPIVGGDVVQGVFCQLIDRTKRVLDDRRITILSQLANETLKAQTLGEACSIISSILNQHTSDVPFTLTYLLKSQHETDLCSTSGDIRMKEFFTSLDLSSDEIRYIEGLKTEVSKAVVIPIKDVSPHKPFCVLILGISPSLELNDDYKEFHLILARFLSTILTKIKMLESKQKDLMARDEFISIASHEFKTPITALKLRLALTKRKIDLTKKIGPTHDEMIECIKTADQQADRLISLVDELLDMTRIQRGRFPFTYEKMELCKLIDDVIDRFQEEIHRSGNTIEFRHQGEIHVYWHRSRMDQVFANLISNALRHAPGSRIVIETFVETNFVRIEFADNGPGIPKDKKEKIFNRFESGQTSQRAEGLGLGLYIVREIITGHKGSIEVESNHEEGTLFTILIPLKP